MFATMLAIALAPAPQPAFEVSLKIDAKKNIHDEKYATIEIRNNTNADLELKTNLPSGRSCSSTPRFATTITNACPRNGIGA